ncbi:MAG: carboxylesterase [Solibacillus sp.]
MQKLQQAPFFFEAGSRAVLLLHGFSGSSADVRMLGRFLEKHGYTTHAPHYRGHGVPPEELIISHPDEWWQDVLAAYEFLQQKGYEEIALAGLSLGGVFSLKLGLNKPVKGIVTMCAPMTMRTTDVMFAGVLDYAREYKRREGKNDAQIELEIEAIRAHGMPSLPALQQLIRDVRTQIDELYAPLFVVQSRKDEVIDALSAYTIYEESDSLEKFIKWYEHSPHVITLGQEKEQLHADVLQFLNSLDWHN